MSRRPTGAAAERAAVLKQLLDAETRFDLDYGSGFSNHRPMALHALARLGADAERLQAFAAHYERRLRPAPAAVDWPSGDAWHAHLGKSDHWPRHRDLFAQWLDAEAAGDVLQQVLPRLMQGVAAAAFHGVIRTAHAVAAAHRGELADALACWATRWAPIGHDTPAIEPGTDDPEVLLRRVMPVRTASGFIMPGLRAAAASPGFDALAAHLAVDERTVPRLAGLAAKAYAASGNFSVLHLVTGALAVQELLAFVDTHEQPAARRAFWRAFLATVAAAGIERQPPAPARPWPALKAAARASDDEHVIKLVDACVQWQARESEGDWAAAAARAVAG